MPRITDPSLLAQLETSQGAINKTAGGPAPASSQQLTGDARNTALQKIAALRALGRQLQTSAHSFDQTQNGGGFLHSLGEFMPALFNDKNAKFDATIDSMTPLAKAAFRVPGSGADSDKESAAFLSLVPSRFGSDAGNLEKYRQMANVIQGSVADQRQLLGQPARPPMPRRAMPGAPVSARPAPAKVVNFSDLKD